MEFHGLTLDPFQERAIRGIDAGHTVLVGAPTGTGKTLIAEYAVQRCLTRGEQVIYTAPIKALSNQKFHDFHARFPDRVGILTGDVSINPAADVVVMTTEVLRNTLLEDRQRLDSVAYVVFDEIHYVNDIERGTVWEESIMLCPPHIALVCLSATAPNLDQFAGWIRSVHPVPVDVIVETQRSVPIEKGFFADPIGLCNFDTLRRAASLLKARRYDWERFEKDWPRRSGTLATRTPRRAPRPTRRRGGRRRRHEDHHTALRLLDYLAENDRLPCLFFSPMRRLCEVRARYLAERYQLAPAEQARVLARFDELCELQGLTDQPPASQMRELVSSGVAYHHAGLLPALKQVIERLFAAGLLRALFATETFAVGVNMPARSVAFDGLEKFDGRSMRPLMAREFQQMSGRAGRRGIDPRGYVYLQIDLQEFRPAAAEHAVFGPTEPTDSQFDLSYSSILNLYEQYGDGLYEIALRSFACYQAADKMARIEERLRHAAGRAGQTPQCPCGRPERRTSFHAQRRRLARAAQTAKWAQRAVRKAGRNPPRELVAQANAARAFHEELKADLEDVECSRCDHARACDAATRSARQGGAAVLRLGNQKEQLAIRYSQTIRRRFDLLGGLGYVSGGKLTSKGRIAKHIFGYEIPVAELLFNGYFEKLNEIEMNILVASIVFEAKRSVWYRDGGRGAPLLVRAERMISRLVRRERRLGLPCLIKPLDVRLTSAVRAWSAGASFQELADHTSSSGGVLVRAFRLMLDLYRQIKRAMPEHAALIAKINRAVDLIDRAPVDPERELTGGDAAGPARSD